MENPLLSIIIPVYKTEKTLYRCLDSVFGQLSDNDGRVEVMVVNDASPDDCGELLKRYREHHPSLRIVTHEVNKGEAGAHNTGIAESKGAYYTFLDSDDTYRSEAIAKIIEAINKYHPDLIHYAYARVDENGNFKSRSNIETPGMHAVDTEIEEARRSIFHDTAFGIMTAGGVYRRDVAPGLKMDSRFPISGERYYGWQFFAKCRTVCLMNDVLYDYYQYPNTLSRVMSDKAVEGLLELDVRFWREMKQHPQFNVGGKYAFKRLFLGVIGWHYNIVFEAEPEKKKFADKYFEDLYEYLKSSRAFLWLGLGALYLRLAVRLKSPVMVAVYRKLVVNLWWRIKRKLKMWEL